MHIVSKILFIIAIGLLCYCQYFASHLLILIQELNKFFYNNIKIFKIGEKLSELLDMADQGLINNIK